MTTKRKTPQKSPQPEEETSVQGGANAVDEPVYVEKEAVVNFCFIQCCGATLNQAKALNEEGFDAHDGAVTDLQTGRHPGLDCSHECGKGRQCNRCRSQENQRGASQEIGRLVLLVPPAEA
jgi:hypothetical protein